MAYQASDDDLQIDWDECTPLGSTGFTLYWNLTDGGYNHTLAHFGCSGASVGLCVAIADEPGTDRFWNAGQASRAVTAFLAHCGRPRTSSRWVGTILEQCTHTADNSSSSSEGGSTTSNGSSSTDDDPAPADSNAVG